MALWAAAAFVLTLGSVLALRPVAVWAGLIDRPDARKRHEIPTPAVGGLAIFLAIGAFSLTLVLRSREILGFDLAGLVLVVSGVIDDRHRLRWRARMAAQVAAAVILIVVAGLRVDDLASVFGGPGRLAEPWSYLLTIFATVGIINAVNMTDGVDGLAGSVCLVAITTLSGLAVYAGNLVLARDLVVVAAALTAFLLFNLRFPWSPRAAIFLGNAGAELLGLIIAAASFRLTQNPHHPISPKLAPFLLAPALIDCLTLVVRRMRRGDSPFAADRDHLHHLLLDGGLSPSAVVFVIAAATLVIAALAVAAAKAHVIGAAFAVTFVALWAAYGFATRSRAAAVSWISRAAGSLGIIGRPRDAGRG
jgi:UDP-GlcNAc:undecaprenyl-phosphate GlcNAc-1-phosphate transferase